MSGIIADFRRNPTDESNVTVGKGGTITAYGFVELKPRQLIELGQLLVACGLDGLPGESSHTDGCFDRCQRFPCRCDCHKTKHASHGVVPKGDS